MSGFTGDSNNFVKLSEMANIAAETSGKLCDVCDDSIKNDILPQTINSVNVPINNIPIVFDSNNCGDFACLNVK